LTSADSLFTLYVSSATSILAKSLTPGTLVSIMMYLIAGGFLSGVEDLD